MPHGRSAALPAARAQASEARGATSPLGRSLLLHRRLLLYLRRERSDAKHSRVDLRFSRQGAQGRARSPRARREAQAQAHGRDHLPDAKAPPRPTLPLLPPGKSRKSHRIFSYFSHFPCFPSINLVCVCFWNFYIRLLKSHCTRFPHMPHPACHTPTCRTRRVTLFIRTMFSTRHSFPV